jgi:hypothetical protein
MAELDHKEAMAVKVIPMVFHTITAAEAEAIL